MEKLLQGNFRKVNFKADLEWKCIFMIHYSFESLENKNLRLIVNDVNEIHQTIIIIAE